MTIIETQIIADWPSGYTLRVRKQGGEWEEARTDRDIEYLRNYRGHIITALELAMKKSPKPTIVEEKEYIIDD